MKRLIYFTYLGLLAVMMMACEKDQIAPASASSDLTSDLRGGSNCTNYSYQTKTGPFELGVVRTDLVLVAFMPGVTPTQQAGILGRFNIFKGFSSSWYTDSGDEVQFVTLKTNATCTSVEAMLSSLRNNANVKYAEPAFTAPPNSGLVWLGLTNEFLVTLANPSQVSKLQKLVGITKTVIVDDWGNGTYLMATTSNSPGNVLQMSTYFNQNSAISVAEPNYIYQLAPFKYQKRSDLLKAQTVAAN